MRFASFAVAMLAGSGVLPLGDWNPENLLLSARPVLLGVAIALVGSGLLAVLRVVPLEAMPLTTGGKVDRRALPAQGGGHACAALVGAGIQEPRRRVRAHSAPSGAPPASSSPPDRGVR